MAKGKQSVAAADAVEILYRRYYQGRPERIRALEEARSNDSVARKLTALRLQAGMTQRHLAKLVGITVSAICRLEDADYEGHSLAMLNHIAAALKQHVVIALCRFPRRRNSKQHDAADSFSPHASALPARILFAL